MPEQQALFPQQATITHRLPSSFQSSSLALQNPGSTGVCCRAWILSSLPKSRIKACLMSVSGSVSMTKEFASWGRVSHLSSCLSLWSSLGYRNKSPGST